MLKIAIWLHHVPQWVVHRVAGAAMRKQAFQVSVRSFPRWLDELQGLRRSWDARGVSGAATVAEQAFVFDIDGVLRKGKRTLPQAQEALRKLYTEDRSRPKFPLCFLTNGGGVSESTKAKQLTDWLGVNVAPDQVVLAHTPMRDLVPRLADSPVLLSGRGTVKSVASEYGFKKTVTTEELGRAMPTATPFSSYPSLDGEGGRICPVRGDGLGTQSNPFKAVLVFTDPSDWARDLQLIVDVVMSGGVPGRVKLPPGSAPVEVFFSHADLLWANDFPAPRFGQGAFSLAFESLYKATTGKSAPVTCFGKPTPSPYRLAEKLLMKQVPPHLHNSTQHPPFSRIYMIGDNPAADVRGARNAKHPWVSVLVKTGVFSKDEINSKEDPADIVADDVLEFVKSVV
ncbi:hypothetical protein BSKO_09516 [Bryopsis sp. KO-2023]|nr:hypothetical protein BSKO_09516 [Bryopsis sp. KO-2023]